MDGFFKKLKLNKIYWVSGLHVTSVTNIFSFDIESVDKNC